MGVGLAVGLLQWRELGRGGLEAVVVAWEGVSFRWIVGAKGGKIEGGA